MPNVLEGDGGAVAEVDGQDRAARTNPALNRTPRVHFLCISRKCPKCHAGGSDMTNNPYAIIQKLFHVQAKAQAEQNELLLELWQIWGAGMNARGTTGILRGKGRVGRVPVS